jgi:multicomponent Na+:H+ antiporter subunit F
VINATFAVLVLAALGFSFRLLRGPDVADRLIGMDGLVLVGLAAIAVQAMATGNGAFLPVLVVLTLVGFVGTAAAARFIERPDDDADEPDAGAGAGGPS